MREIEFFNGRWKENFKFGRNPDIDTAAAEDIIEQGGLVQYDSGGALYEVVSADAGDTGTGWVEGLDSNYDWVREKFTLNGTTPVALTTSWYTVFRARLDFIPDGLFTTRTVTGSNTRIIITPPYGGTLFAAFSVPRNYEVRVSSIDVEIVRPIGGDTVALIYLLKRDIGGPWTIQDSMEHYSPRPTGRKYEVPLRFTGPTDIKLNVASVGSNSLSVSGDISFWLINNTPNEGTCGPILVGF